MKDMNFNASRGLLTTDTRYIYLFIYLHGVDSISLLGSKFIPIQKLYYIKRISLIYFIRVIYINLSYIITSKIIQPR